MNDSSVEDGATIYGNHGKNQVVWEPYGQSSIKTSVMFVNLEYDDIAFAFSQNKSGDEADEQTPKM